eukprot:1900460-Amphidinium_carterae.1
MMRKKKGVSTTMKIMTTRRNEGTNQMKKIAGEKSHEELSKSCASIKAMSADLTKTNEKMRIFRKKQEEKGD